MEKERIKELSENLTCYNRWIEHIEMLSKALIDARDGKCVLKAEYVSPLQWREIIAFRPDKKDAQTGADVINRLLMATDAVKDEIYDKIIKEIKNAKE